jgi:hypothetical protein
MAAHRPRLVFLGGVAAGGTDLLRNVVNAHAEIDMPLEFPFLAQVAAKFGSTVDASRAPDLVLELARADACHNFKRVAAPLPPRREYTAAEIYVHMLGVDPAAVWTGNKTPTNAENIDKLRRLFPDARFIVIARDPRDVALSWRRKWGKAPILAAAKWDRRMRNGLACARRLPASDVLIVRYEDLLADLDGICRRICDFLELGFDDRMLHFDRYVAERIAGKYDIGSPDRERWRTELDAATVRRIEEIAYEGMRLLGYRPELARDARPLSRVEAIGAAARDAWATVGVGNRAVNDRKRGLRVAFELRKRVMRAARG